MATYINSVSSTGTLTATQAAAPGAVWNLTFLSVSFAGPSRGPNARLSIYDGAAGTGTLLFRVFLDQPTLSVGYTQNITLPQDQRGNVGIQSSPGAAMNIVVEGFGANIASLNARIVDGLP